MGKTNTILTYNYRDASNYKSTTTLFVEGEMSEEDMARILASCNNTEELEFVPEAIGLPLARPGEYQPQDDHPWAYFYQKASDNYNYTDKDIVCDIKLGDLIKLFEGNAKNWDRLAAEQEAFLESEAAKNKQSDEEDEEDEGLDVGDTSLLVYLAGPITDPERYMAYAKGLERSGATVLNLLEVRKALPMEAIPEYHWHHIDNLLLTLCDTVALMPGHETDLHCSRAKTYANDGRYIPVMTLTPKILEKEDRPENA